jgi:two-component system, NtrC family, nitrogen regulation response regulator NtrX
MAAELLIVDDDPNIRRSFSALLREQKYRTTESETAEQALLLCEHHIFDLILLDIQLPRMSGIDFLRHLREMPDPPLVLVISGQADIPMALEAIKLGAVDFLEKPVSPEKLITSVHSCLLLAHSEQQRRIFVTSTEHDSQIIGQSQAVRKLLQTIGKVAPTDSTVLITGQNGTGKELVATRIFLESKRRDKPFIKVNCPGIPETLFESELFGHLKGAFTGAVKNFPGKFALADGGTIFLDEIGDLPLNLQAKLLRVLETGEIETLGMEERRQVDVRIICATNHSLEKLVSEGRFRQDLYYRITVFKIEVPPLSDRIDDIPLLAGSFLARFDPSGQTRLSPEAVTLLLAQPYPGNIRQLKNIIERLSIMYRGRIIQPEDIRNQAEPNQSSLIQANTTKGLSAQLEQFEQTLLKRTLQECKNNISEAARILQIDRSALSKKIKEYGIK